MNDAIALLAISQLVCLGAILYLYTQLQSLKSRARTRRPVTISARAHPMASPVEVAPRQTARAASAAYAAAKPAPAKPTASATSSRGDAANLASRLAEMGVDVPALARRMQKSEEEVRLLLRRQGAVR